jgi:hypothetical protein
VYKDDQKVILLTKNTRLKEELESYFSRRYNLAIEPVTDILEVFEMMSVDDPNDLVIFDEAAAGLQPLSHALRTLKSRYTQINVLFLSTLLELAEPFRSSEMELLPGYEIKEYRSEQIDLRMEKHLALITPLTTITSLNETYQTVSKIMMQIYEVDWCTCVVLRLDEKPVNKGVVASEYPLVFTEPQEFSLNGTNYMKDMLTHFKPLHIPDLAEEEAFRKELEDKFSRRFRSVLLLPMQYDGNCIGFIGLFTLNTTRLYRLPDLDLLQRFADVATVSIITRFYQEHGNFDIDEARERIRRKETGWEGLD